VALVACVSRSGSLLDASRWVVHAHFRDNQFLPKVARPRVEHEIAIDVDGVVQSAPLIKPGIVGNEIQIASDYSKQEAIRLAIRG